MEKINENIVIIGSGPAGLTAAIYAARAALSPLVVCGLMPGGQLTTTTIVENWPGEEDGIDGTKLMQKMRLQAERMGARFLETTVDIVTVTPEGTFQIQADDKTLLSQTVLIATGAIAKVLPLPEVKKLMGYGVSTCAVCDGFFYRGKKVAVVGGGDSAIEEALYLAKLADSVTLVHRREEFRASKIMQTRVQTHPKIKLILNTEVTKLTSNEQGLTGLELKNKSGESSLLEVDGLFMAIGHIPSTSFLKSTKGLEFDDEGYLLTLGGSTATSVPGLYAAGDVEDKLYRQAITSAGRGCQAALDIEHYLESKKI